MKTKSELMDLFQAYVAKVAGALEPTDKTYDETITEGLFMCFCAGYTLGVTQQQVGDV